MNQSNQLALAATIDATPDSKPMGGAGDAAASLGAVRAGLSVIYFAFILMLLCIVAPILSAPFVSGPLGLMQVLGAVVIALTVARVMLLIGPILCLNAPAESGARWPIFGSVILMSASILMGILKVGMMGLSAEIVSYGATVLFLLFLRNIALFLEREDLARRATTVLVVGAVVVSVFMVLPWLVLAALAAKADSLVMALGAVAIVNALLGLATALGYVKVINELRKAIA